MHVLTSLDDILLHSPPMRLIDSITELDPDYIRCKVTINEASIFYDSTIQGIYAWVGVELMAQAVAAYAGSHKAQTKPALGLLLSVRKFQTQQPYFKLGQELTIVAHKDYVHEMVGVFNCEIFIDGKLIASAKLNTIEPPADKITAILKGQKI